MKWNVWNRIVTAATLCALVLLAGSHGASAADGDGTFIDKHTLVPSSANTYLTTGVPAVSKR